MQLEIGYKGKDLSKEHKKSKKNDQVLKAERVWMAHMKDSFLL